MSSSSGLYAQGENQQIEVISNPKLPIAEGDVKIKLAFKEELSIGQIEGDENYMFGGAVAFNTDSDGYFYVTDFENSRVIKYNPAGEFILSFGTRGQGPGEFQLMSVVRFDKDGNLYLTDTSNRRISFFEKNGDFLRQMSLTDRYLDLYIDSEGHAVARKRFMPSPPKTIISSSKDTATRFKNID
jgi:DNA-binding beta-propeller fold protein YncE